MTAAPLKTGLAAAAVALLAALVLLAPALPHWRAPWQYEGDGIFYRILLRSWQTGGTWMENRCLGLPAVHQVYDFPVSDSVFYFGLPVALLAALADDTETGLNLWYLLTFPLVAGVAAAAMRALGGAGAAAVTAGVLYAFLPWHFMQYAIGHFHYVNYVAVPLLAFVALRLTLPGPVRPARLLLLTLLGAMAGNYQAALGAVLLAAAGGLALLMVSPGRARLAAGLLAGLLLVTLALNLPTALFYRMAGNDAGVLTRSLRDVEGHSLKLAWLFLPVYGHRVPAMAALTEDYLRATFPPGEQFCTALGLFGAAGLLALLISIARPGDGATRRGIMWRMGLLTGAALLVAVPGGLASLFGLSVSNLVRVQCRMGIFTAFYALTALALLLERADEVLRARGAAGVARLLPAAVLLLGLVDQTSTLVTVPPAAANAAAYAADRDLVRRLEAVLPADAMVFQLPFRYFPESEALVSLPEYEPGKLVLHSTRLRWSYGAMRRRDDAFHRRVAALPAPAQVAALRAAGFAAVLVDGRGYADGGAGVVAALRAAGARSGPGDETGRILLFLP